MVYRKRSSFSRPPPAYYPESSEDKGSGLGAGESEEEVEIANSLPAAADLENASRQSEASDEEKEEEEASEEEEEAGYGDERDEEAGDGEEEDAGDGDERDEEAGDGEEEGEGEEEAGGGEAEGNRRRERPRKKNRGRSLPWSVDDEVRLLQAVAAYHREHGQVPQPEVLKGSLAGIVDRSDSLTQLDSKVRSLKKLYTRAVIRGGLTSKNGNRERRLFPLCKEIWGNLDNPANSTARHYNKPAGGSARRSNMAADGSARRSNRPTDGTASRPADGTARRSSRLADVTAHHSDRLANSDKVANDTARRPNKAANDTARCSYKAANGTVRRPDKPTDDGTVHCHDRPVKVNITVPWEFGKMCEAYPYLGEEMKAADREHPGLFKRAFCMIDSDEAESLNREIKKLRVKQIKVEQRCQRMKMKVVKMLLHQVQ